MLYFRVDYFMSLRRSLSWIPSSYLFMNLILRARERFLSFCSRDSASSKELFLPAKLESKGRLHRWKEILYYCVELIDEEHLMMILHKTYWIFLRKRCMWSTTYSSNLYWRSTDDHFVLSASVSTTSAGQHKCWPIQTSRQRRDRPDCVSRVEDGIWTRDLWNHNPAL